MEMFSIKCRNLPYLLTAAASLGGFVFRVEVAIETIAKRLYFHWCRISLHLLLPAAVETHRDIRNLKVYS